MSMIKVELDRSTAHQTQKLLKDFSRLTGEGVEEGIKDVGLSVARALAMRVQPYGTKEAQGKKFIKSIGGQVDRAYIAVNLGATSATSSMADAHRQMRNSRGVVPNRQFRKEKGVKWKGLISQSEKEQYKRKVQAKAGRAKAAWIAAGNSIGRAKISHIAQWIARHISSGRGSHEIKGKGLKLTLVLINSTPYISKLQKTREIIAAQKLGFKNGYARIQKIVDAKLKKLAKQSK